jgi:hypothetical protein
MQQGRKFGCNWGLGLLSVSKVDCKTLCPMSRIRSVTARPSPPWWIYSQRFAPFPNCYIIFHSHYYLVRTVIHVQSVRGLIYIYIYTHTHTHIPHNTVTLVGQKKEKNWDSSECRLTRKSFRVSQVTIQAARSHSDTSHSAALLWTSDQPDAEIST